MRLHHIKRIMALALAACLLFLLSGCAPKTYEKHTTSFFGTFDTVITIQGFAASKEAFDRVAAKAQERFKEYHQLFDRYHPYEGINNLHTLNHTAAQGPVKVAQPLFDLLQYSKQTQAATHGMVNIAFGTVLELWHDARDAAEASPADAYLPDMTKLKAASLDTDINDLVLDQQALTVYYADPALQIDLGAIAKGYAAELVAQEMLRSEVKSFYINAGGNVRLGHGPMDGRKNWGVAIQDPDGMVTADANTDILDVLFLHDSSIVTSGDYQRFFLYEGKRYHHIVSPKTLMPTDYMRSVTIVTEDSGYADLLSTAVFLMPYEEGRAFVDSLQGVEALWVLNDRSIQMTDGLQKNARSMGATNPTE